MKKRKMLEKTIKAREVLIIKHEQSPKPSPLKESENPVDKESLKEEEERNCP